MQENAHDVVAVMDKIKREEGRRGRIEASEGGRRGMRCLRVVLTPHPKTYPCPTTM